MDFHDFPRFLGKSGKLSHHPPKLCASLAMTLVHSRPGLGVRRADGAVEAPRVRGAPQLPRCRELSDDVPASFVRS